jgi:cyclophilin family peptidyl-prolyl cis-trans isomerase
MKNRTKRISLLLLIAAVCVFLAACGSKTSPNTGKTPTATPAVDTGKPSNKSWTSAPAMTINPTKTYVATFDTSKGSFKVQLLAEDAPKTVNSFVFLSKEGFYNNVVFHRILQNFMIQTGDPTGSGTGGPGYTIPDELLSNPNKYATGTVAMANTGKPNTGGSQFFICMNDECGGLNNMPNYTIFGTVSNGFDIVQKIAATPVKAGPRGEMSVPTEEVKIKSITINEQ